jgi:hypothetical protein
LRLFTCPNGRPSKRLGLNTIVTPLGVLRLHASVGEMSIDQSPPEFIWETPSGGDVVVWRLDGLTAELLVCRPKFGSPADAPVTDCYGVLWRLRADSDTGPLLFTVQWDVGYLWQTGGPDSGQYLYAKTWTDEVMDVTAGTEDDDALLIRSEKGQRLPKGWDSHLRAPRDRSFGDRSLFWSHPAHTAVLDTGIACPLPGLRTGEEAEIKFAVAWVESLKNYASTSIATEVTADEILAGGLCS